uniref:Uncharacterized protein n=1 Tax=Neospora caninum (strain Liverpool) TaxID=572307 RepID=A0A0F7UHC2_NEOCL|nr:TPA: hypothetical protein BN1204_034630 [Neospora caninum Liverpool]
MKIAKRDLQSIIGDLRHEIRKQVRFQVYNVERQYMNTAKPQPRALLYSSGSFLPGPEAARFLEVKPRKETLPASPLTTPEFRQTDRVRPRQEEQGDGEIKLRDILSDIAAADRIPQPAAKKEIVLADGEVSQSSLIIWRACSFLGRE